MKIQVLKHWKMKFPENTNIFEVPGISNILGDPFFLLVESMVFQYEIFCCHRRVPPSRH